MAGGKGTEERGATQSIFGWLRERPRILAVLTRWSKEADADSKSGEPAKKAKEPPPAPGEHVSVSTARGKVKVEIHHQAGAVADEAKGKADEKEKPGSDPLGSGLLKVAGAAAAAIGATGAIVAVGAAVLWIRFNEAGLPAMQAVSVQPKYEALVQGGQQTVAVLMIALVAALLIYFADPGGEIRRVTLLTFLFLFAVACFCTLETNLDTLPKFGLIALAAFLAVGAIIVGTRTDKRFWPLGFAVFLAALIFASASALLISRQQDFVQAVAVLRGSEDSGLTGIYVAAGEKTLYIARPVPIPTDDGSSKLAMMDIPREGAMYAVGPLESQAKARQRARVMLARLVEARERNPSPAEPEEATEEGAGAEAGATEGEGTEEDASSEGMTEGGSASASESTAGLERVLRAFRVPVRIEQRVTRGACLVRYGDAATTVDAGSWWTSCGEAERMKTVAEVRERLALPPGRFQGAYDAKIEATLHAGTDVLVVRGKAAA
ncbi:MAG TPA: hypothetical protein VFJ76_00550, partial [Solirubrobacterales bacterium]|nr:hypothetical protein [Solirubrobacterales bacterium]